MICIANHEWTHPQWCLLSGEKRALLESWEALDAMLRAEIVVLLVVTINHANLDLPSPDNMKGRN